MKRQLVTLLLAGALPAFGQQTDTVRQLPKLEIPEITIIGKKAITLPFARKGEVFDVELHEEPAPDSSLYGTPPAMSILTGSLPRYEHRLDPWRASLEGTLGSFPVLGGRGIADYYADRWSAGGSIGFLTTDKLHEKIDGTTFDVAGRFRSLLSVGRVMWGAMKFSGDGAYRHRSYKLYGDVADLKRNAAGWSLGAAVASIGQEPSAVQASFALDVRSVDDRDGALTGSASAVSPAVSLSVFRQVGAGAVAAALDYKGSSVDYPGESPSLFTLSASGQAKLASRLDAELGVFLARGTAVNGDERYLVTPTGLLRWRVDDGRQFAVWFRPRMTLRTYGEALEEIPYLQRAIDLQPERVPIVVGGSLTSRDHWLTLEIRGEISRSSNTAVPISDLTPGNARLVQFAYVEATAAEAQMLGTLRPVNAVRLSWDARLTIARESGSSSQLAMTPPVHATGRWELDLRANAMVWAGVEFIGPRNVDRDATSSLSSVILLGGGVDWNVFPGASLSGEVRNLLDSSYDLWPGIEAPGLEILGTLRLHLR